LLALREQHAAAPRLLAGRAERHVARADVEVRGPLADAAQRRSPAGDVASVAACARAGRTLACHAVAGGTVACVELRAKLSIAQRAFVRRARDAAGWLRLRDCREPSCERQDDEPALHPWWQWERAR